MRVVVGLLLLFAMPAPGAGQRELADSSRNLRIEFGGWIQPRYEYVVEGGDSDHSNMFMRRARVEVRGQIFTERLTFRIQPELARTTELRDAYVDYAFAPMLAVRIGQFPVPFQFRVSPRRQQFSESGVASRAFSHPTTRDVGVLVGGRSAERRFDWAAGLFGGAGMNARRSPATGNLVALRVHYAALGTLPRKASDEGRDARTLAVGIGGQAAWANELLDWSLGRSVGGIRRGDWITGVVDAQLLYHGLTAFASAFVRGVSPADARVASYRGWGVEGSVGYAVVEDRMELVARWGQSVPDAEVVGTRERGWAVGASWYLRGHAWKFRAEYGRRLGGLDVARPDEVQSAFVLDSQILF